MTSARILLLCHASTEAIRKLRFPQGEGLDFSGERACTALAGRFAWRGQAVTGPERAARETAGALTIRAGVEPQLRDLDCGRWAGLALDDVQAAEPEALAAWLADPDTVPHGGESVAGLIARVGGWLDASGAAGGRRLAIAQPAVLRAAIVHGIGAPATSFWRFDVAPLAFVDLRGGAGRWSLRGLGTLPPEP